MAGDAEGRAGADTFEEREQPRHGYGAELAARARARAALSERRQPEADRVEVERQAAGEPRLVHARAGAPVPAGSAAVCGAGGSSP